MRGPVESLAIVWTVYDTETDEKELDDAVMGNKGPDSPTGAAPEIARIISFVALRS